MLARVVENVYWLARYLERAENTARLIGVNANLLLDLPPGYAPGWLPLIDITGSRAVFDARPRRADEAEVVQFLIADLDNPGSLACSLKMARENARALRDVLPTDAWEVLNQFYLEFNEELPAASSRRARFNFLKRIVLTSQTLSGVLDGTMNRNDAHTFAMLGRNLERADMTSRIADVRSAKLQAAAAGPQLSPFDSIQWMSVLKSLSAYEMFRLSRRTRVSPRDALEFVLRDEQFPRACLYCLLAMERDLCTLPRSVESLEAVAGASRFLREAHLDGLDPRELHELIDRLQLHLNGVHERIARTYFQGRDGANGEPPWRRDADAPRTLPLFVSGS